MITSSTPSLKQQVPGKKPHPLSKVTAKEREFQQKVEQTRDYLDMMRRGNKESPKKPKNITSLKQSQTSSTVKKNDRSNFGRQKEISASQDELIVRTNRKDMVNQSFSNNEQNVTVNRRRNTKKTFGKSSEQRMKEVMNTSFSKMLDRQLLAGSEVDHQRPNIKTVSSNVLPDSMTNKIFHDGKIYLGEGKMAFQPLGIETVLQPIAEKKRRTTEGNIKQQHRIDQASVEDFISCRRMQLMNFSVTEDQVNLEIQNQKKKNSRNITNAYQGDQTPTRIRNPARNQQLTLSTPQRKQKLETKRLQPSSSLQTINSILKHKEVDNSRELHRGLAQMEEALKNRSQGNFSPMFSQKNSAIYLGTVNMDNQHTPISVKFDDNVESMRSNTIDHRMQKEMQSLNSNSQSMLITGAENVEGTLAERRLGDMLHRQQSRMPKEISRRLRVDRTIEYAGDPVQDQGKLDVDLVLQNSIPKSRKTEHSLQPQLNKDPSLEFNDSVSYKSTIVHDERESHVAKQYRMALKNKQRIQSLMALLGGRKAQTQGINTGRSEVDINIGDSISNIDDSRSILIMNHNSGSPNNKERDDSLLEDRASTQIGTQGISKNAKSLADYTRRVSQPGRQGAGIFISSVNSTSNAQDFMTIQHKQTRRDLSVEDQSEPNARKKTFNEEDFKTLQQQNQKHVQSDFLKDLSKSQVGISKEHQQNQRDDKSHLLKLSNPKIGSRYQKVRSFLYNKNPIFDKMDASAMSQNFDDRFSELPDIGNKNKLGPQSTSQPYLNINEHSDTVSVRTLNARSITNRHRLKPINYQEIKGRRSSHEIHEKKQNRAQSLKFNQGLSFVLRKGKAQPTEKYIYNQMLPYTSAQKYASIQVKSSVNRHYLIMQENPTSTLPLKSKTNSNYKSNPDSSNQRKSKGAGKSLKAGGHTSSQVHLTKNHRKGIIMEMEEEYSISGDSEDGSTRYEVGGRPMHQDPMDQIPWEEMQAENEGLKDQLMTQIAIFEQYLKVAVLQRKARKKEEQEEAKRFGLKTLNKKAGQDQFIKAKDFQFDTKALKEEFRQVMKKNKAKKDSSPAKLRRKKSSLTINKDSEYVIMKSPAKNLNQSRSNHKNKYITPLTRDASKASIKSRTSVHSSANSQGSQKTTIIHKGGDIKNGEANVSYKILSKKVNKKNMRALEHLMPIQGDLQPGTSHFTTHTAHQIWIARIQDLWKSLNRNRNADAVRIQNEIKRNKHHIEELMRENLFELDINSHEQRLLLGVKASRRKIVKGLKNIQEEHKIQEIQKRIRDEMARKAQYFTWGITSLVMEQKIKIRATEDLIECAQRLTVKPNVRTERELQILKTLRDRTYDDIYYFVNEREKKHWRLWDKHGGHMYKPNVETRVGLSQLSKYVDLHLVMIADIERRFSDLVQFIPPYNQINAEMIQLCTIYFGNEGWLQFFQLKQLRKLQDKEQHAKQFVPPVDLIKKFQVDPYTIQAIPGAADLADHYDENGKFKSKWIRLEQEQMAKKLSSLPKSIQAIEPIIKITQVSEGPELSQIGELIPEVEETQRRLLESEHAYDGYPLTPTSLDKQMAGQMPKENDAELISEKASVKSALPKGQGMKRLEGDIAESIRAQAAELDKRHKVQSKAKEIKKTSWLEVLEKERKNKADREEAERQERAARLANLFVDDDDVSVDGERALDFGAADAYNALFLDKIENHLQMEKKLLEAFDEKDNAIETAK